MALLIRSIVSIDCYYNNAHNKTLGHRQEIDPTQLPWIVVAVSVAIIALATTVITITSAGVWYGITWEHRLQSRLGSCGTISLPF